ncbi:hypothetical protein GBA52_027214 [Prunus armeniaca]|nr:hypothetical protein GBA52_027214 [Prunus armeniaca]
MALRAFPSDEPSPRLGGKKKNCVPAEQPRPEGGVGPTTPGWPEGNFCLRSKTRGVTVALQYLLQLLQSATVPR